MMLTEPRGDGVRCVHCGMLIWGKPISVNGEQKAGAYSKDGHGGKKHYCIDCAIQLGFITFQQGFKWYMGES